MLPPLPDSLTALEPDTREALLSLLASSDIHQVTQGCELILSLGDRALIDGLRAGLSLDSGQLRVEGIGLRYLIDASLRPTMALFIARHFGLLDGVTQFGVDRTSQLPASALRMLDGMETIRGLHVHYCDSLETLDQLPDLPGLQALQLRGCTKLRAAPDDGLPPSLRTLELQHLNRLQDLTFVHHLPNLRGLRLSSCTVTDMAPLGALSTLRKLELRSQDLPDLALLAPLVQLRWLDLSYVMIPLDLADLPDLPQLEVLHLTGSRIRFSPADLRRFRSLRRFTPPSGVTRRILSRRASRG